jgi:hypothetical protein
MSLSFFLLSVPLFASDLNLVVRAHPTLMPDGATQQLVNALFADEVFIADLQLDVYAVPQLPSTSAHLQELRRLTTQSWIDRVQWQLTRKDGEAIAMTSPSIVSNARRDRGPRAALEADRDTGVECTTFRAAVKLPPLPPGDFALTASLDSLSSHFDFVVRTGKEPEWRDVYLRERAASAKSYAEYRTIALQRLAADPDRIDVLMDLFDRSLQAGTLEESKSYIDRAKAAAMHRQQTDAIPYLDQVSAELPDYFAHRDRVTMIRNVTNGKYEIHDRGNGALVRIVEARIK